jgi:hypothetical protein
MGFFVVPSKDVAEISEKIRQDYIRENPHVSREQPRMILVKSLQKFKDRWDLQA